MKRLLTWKLPFWLAVVALAAYAFVAGRHAASHIPDAFEPIGRLSTARD